MGRSESDLVTKSTSRSVVDTVSRLVGMIEARGMRLFAALDLPLRVLIWADGDETRVSYYAPSALNERHRFDPDLTRSLAGIDALTDALVGR